jgi:hypothetical protein
MVVKLLAPTAAPMGAPVAGEVAGVLAELRQAIRGLRPKLVGGVARGEVVRWGRKVGVLSLIGGCLYL